MKFYNFIIEKRTIRKFKKKNVPENILKKCVNAARLSSSASNLQPLEYIIITNKNLLEKIYENLGWARYIPEFNNEKAKPQSYIIILLNKKISKNADKDIGISAERICLVAKEQKLGSCMIGDFNRKIKKILKIPKNYDPALIIALGYPAEKSKVVRIKNGIKYYYESGVLKVPKRELSSILHINQF